MDYAVFCIANNMKQAEQIVRELVDKDYSKENISVLYANGEFNAPGEWHKGQTITGDTNVTVATGKKPGITTEKNTKAPEGAAIGGTTGGVIGGTLGLLAGIGALAIPGMGPFIAAGPIMAALAGSAVGGSIGLLTGALVGLGIPEYEAVHYAELLKKKSNILIAVHTKTSEQVEEIENVFERNGAQDISHTRETAGGRGKERY